MKDSVTDDRFPDDDILNREDFFHAMFNTFPLGMGLANTSGIAIAANPAMAEIFACSVDDLVGSDVSDLYASLDDREQMLSILRVERKVSDYEVQLKKKNGQLFYASMGLNLISAGGRDIIQAAILDITARKMSETSIRENYIFLEKLTASLGATVFSVKLPERTIEWANASQEVFGYLPEELVGHTTEILYAQNEEYLKFGKGLRDIIESGSSTMYRDSFLKRKSGESFRAEVATSVYRENNVPVRVISIIRDVTAQRKEEEMREISARLESIGVLAGGIAHDFNNILTGIMGNIGLARISLDDGDTEEVYSLLEEAENASLRARDLTQQLLTFSRGGQPIKQVRSIAEMLQPSVQFASRGSSVKTVFNIASSVSPIELDEGQINQVISNIVINAQQAMPNGGTLTVKAMNLPDRERIELGLREENFVAITFSDTGQGIAEDDLRHVFEPYFTTKAKGNGLGLTTCYSIINKHDGDIRITSLPGQGTTVSIYLPASAGIVEDKPEELPVISESVQGTILVMDDEETIRNVLIRGLSHAGYQVMGVENGESAIRVYARAREMGRPFSAVIMDLTVPGGMGGKDAVVKIREIDPDAIVLVSSGYATDPIMSDYKKYGFSGVVEKPYSIEKVIKVLTPLLHL